MRVGEEIFTEIMSIAAAEEISMGDAVLKYAEITDVDVEDVVKALDSSALAQLRENLSRSLALRPSQRRVKKTVEIDFGI